MFIAARGLIYAGFFVLLWSWLAFTVHRYDASLPLAIPGWLQPVGLAIAVLGGLTAVSCIVLFVSRGRGTPAPFDPPRVFVATGPYRFVRNPMYLGAGGIIAGAGLMLGSPAIVLLAVVFCIAAHVSRILRPGAEGGRAETLQWTHEACPGTRFTNSFEFD
jgi:protein-S-isoprenylcysteine O-methyltransferase Ste14